MGKDGPGPGGSNWCWSSARGFWGEDRAVSLGPEDPQGVSQDHQSLGNSTGKL